MNQQTTSLGQKDGAVEHFWQATTLEELNTAYRECLDLGVTQVSVGRANGLEIIHSLDEVYRMRSRRLDLSRSRQRPPERRMNRKKPSL